MTKKIVGREYRVIGNTGITHHFPIGTVVKLVHDDGTDTPEFRGPISARERGQWVSMSNVELLPTTPADSREIRPYNAAQNIAKKAVSQTHGFPLRAIKALTPGYQVAYRAVRLMQEKAA